MMLLPTMLIFGPSLALSDEPGDMQVPNEAVSLKDLLAVVDKTYQGRVLEVEMEQEEIDGKVVWIYEVKLLTREGKVYELEYNAITLELLKTEN